MVEIAAGTRAGEVCKVTGRGVAQWGGGGKGDLLVKIQVVVPTKLSARQRKLIEELGRGQ